MHEPPRVEGPAESTRAPDHVTGRRSTAGHAAAPAQRVLAGAATASARDDPLGRMLARAVLARQAAAAPSPALIYQIDTATGRAAQISHAAACSALGIKQAALTSAIGPATVVIMRNGRISRSTQATVDQINNPASAPAVISAGIDKLQSDTARLQGTFPPDYYIEFSRAVTEATLRRPHADPDAGVDEVGAAYGTEDFPRGRAVLHLYEALVPIDNDTHFDKVQHFLRSMALQYNWFGLAADTAQVVKEVVYDEIPSWFTSDKGYDPLDMKANNLGQAYGVELTRRFHPTRDLVYSPSTIPDRAAKAAGGFVQQLENEIRRLYGLPGF